MWLGLAMDKVQSIYQGRPARLREMDNRVPMQFLNEYEELEPFSTVTYALNPCVLDCSTYGVSTFREMCRLSIIMDRVLCNLYAERSSSQDPMDLFHTSGVLHEELRSWRESLPNHLSMKLDNPESAAILPHTLSLQ